MVLFLIDPNKQIGKARDTQRKEDFVQIRNAVDTYYNDTNCYPTSIPFGARWRVGEVVYMDKVPQDPSCGDYNAQCYTYVIDPNATCPQWNMLFGKLAITPSQASPACLLQNDCLPSNYSASGYNLCNFGGNIDCAVVNALTMPTPSQSPGLGPSTTPTPTVGGGGPSSTPTPVPTIPGSGIYYCACGASHVTVCNIAFTYPEGLPYYPDPSCSNQCGQPC